MNSECEESITVRFEPRLASAHRNLRTHLPDVSASRKVPHQSTDSTEQEIELSQIDSQAKQLNIQQPIERLENNVELGTNESTSTLELSTQPVSYSRHCNLDVRALSLQESVHLARIHYLTIPNVIRLALVVFCLGWFIFNSVTILSEYLEYGTVVNLEFQPPKITQPPAISICTHCILCT